MRKLATRASQQTWTSISNKKPPSVSSILRTSLLIILTLIVLIPVAWFMLSSFKDLTDLSARPPKILPTRWATEN